jgi:hypothetical protein
MFIFKEMINDINIIHLVMGPETDFQFDANGFISIPLDDKLENGKQNLLHINRCLCEESELIEHFQYISSKYMHKHQNNQDQNSHQNKEPKIVDNKYGIFYKELKCPKCGSLGTYAKNGDIKECLMCYKIDEGVEKVTPISKDEEKILNSLIKNRKKKNQIS